MTEREEEQSAVKVNDRRKFNLDGSLREGVEIEPEKPKEPVKPDDSPSEIINSTNVSAAAAAAAENAAAGMQEEEFDEADFPGADDPASFVNFLSTLATNAAASLGAMPHPATGQRAVDLETGKYWLDVLAMIKEKTSGNLHPREAQLLDGLLGDLRMQYVHVVRATEEKLKQQAAQKFSAGDILGKR